MSDHWYDKDGKPRHEADLRAARKHGYFPSVTTVLRNMPSYQLDMWKQEMAAIAGADSASRNWDDKHGEVYDREWARDIVREVQDETAKKADQGKYLHKSLERYFRELAGGERRKRGLNAEFCYRVECTLTKNTESSGWKPEARFCNTELGYAGMVDLHCDGWIIDFKTKDEVDEKTRGYKNNAVQLAAYARGLELPNARLANVFIQRDNPLNMKFYEHKDSEYHYAYFLSLLRSWQMDKKYGPYYEEWKNEKIAS